MGGGDGDDGVIGQTTATFAAPTPESVKRCGPRWCARSGLNVGAGAGNYEPTDRDVTAVQPSATMRSQRPAGLVPLWTPSPRRSRSR